jgi:ribosomal-protein-alanine N-acetyltransferase
MDDLAAILAVERGSEGPHWTEEQYREALTGGAAGSAVRRRVFVWDGVAGFAVGMVLDAGGMCEGELEHVVVKTEARRKGIGRALGAAVMGWVRELGCGTVRLEVRASDAGAIGLYCGLGFLEVGRRTAYYREPLEDAVLMEAFDVV